MTMRKSRLIAPLLLGFGLVALPALLSEANAAVSEVQTPAPGTSRVWFLRPAGSADGNVWGASPMIYVNGAPVAAIPPGTGFYRDFMAGTYSFTVQPYGLPTGSADTVQLAPGTQTYLEVQWAPTWEEGYPSGGRGGESHSFFVLNMSPQLAQAYLPSLTYLGQR
jgi:hypothetical protein